MMKGNIDQVQETTDESKKKKSDIVTDGFVKKKKTSIYVLNPLTPL